MSTSYPAELKSLTSLRFFAALTIVFQHICNFTPFDATAWEGKGYLAVDFFFILSGFILTHVYYADMHAKNVSVVKFCQRRLARLYPVHLVTLLLMAAVALTPLRFGPVGEWPGYFPIGSFFANLFLVHGWGFDEHLTFNSPSWSISAEWFAYLLFPFLPTLFYRVRPLLLLTLLSFFYLLAWGLTWHFNPDRPLTRFSCDFSILRILPEFSLGVALYLVFSVRTFLTKATSYFWISTFGALAVIHSPLPDLLAIFCFMVMIVCAANFSRARSRTGYWLEKPFFVWLGEISYSLYMVHYPILLMLCGGAYYLLGGDVYSRMFWIICAITVGVILCATILLHYMIELPGRKWINSLSLKRFLPADRQG
jgi:peptidoglycan/LPS O-acetylase OafA/YrhL